MDYKFTYKSEYNEYKDCYFMTGKYSNGNLGIEIHNNEVGPISKVTVNPDIKLPEDYIAVKDYSENVGMSKFLISKGLIVEEPVQIIFSGYVDIPVYKLTDFGKQIFLED